MNFKKNWKRFWTLSSAREGFTLVELIVVIAILAILAGVAVPAYSGYVKKANMQADMTLASEVAHALTLYYYAHPEEVTSGYVVLSQSPATADAVGTKAMEAVFGANWANAAVLKYDGWDTGDMSLAAGNRYTGSVIDSTYINNIGTDVLLGDVQSCAGSLAEFLVGLGWSGEESAKSLNELLGGSGDELPEVLKDYEGEITAEVLANATVFGLADSLSDSAASQEVIDNFANGTYLLQNWDQGKTVAGIKYSPLDDVSDPNTILTETAHTYAALEAFVGYMGLDSANAILDQLNTDIEAASSSGNYLAILNLVSTACQNVMDAAVVGDQAKALAYLDGTAKTDGEAYIGIMQTVNSLNGEYADSLGTSGLFGSTEMADRVNDYVASASVANLLGSSAEGQAVLNKLASGSYGSAIIVFLKDNAGVPECIIQPEDNTNS